MIESVSVTPWSTIPEGIFKQLTECGFEKLNRITPIVSNARYISINLIFLVCWFVRFVLCLYVCHLFVSFVCVSESRRNFILFPLLMQFFLFSICVCISVCLSFCLSFSNFCKDIFNGRTILFLFLRFSFFFFHFFFVFFFFLRFFFFSSSSFSFSFSLFFLFLQPYLSASPIARWLSGWWLNLTAVSLLSFLRFELSIQFCFNP